MAIKAVVFDIGGVLELVEDNDWPEVWMGLWESLTLDDGSIHHVVPLPAITHHQPDCGG